MQEDFDAELGPEAKPVTAEQKLQDELLKQANEAQAKVNELTDAVLRAKADADNARRRARMDIESAHKFGQERFILELLPVIDSLERCLEVPVEPNNVLVKKIHEGVELTRQVFLTALQKHSVEQINPLHEDFNSALHEAVKVEIVPDVKPGSVVAVLQRGYTLNDRVIRPALVAVAKNS